MKIANYTKLIRNFSIIAHIDHGKSTLADRIISYCGGLEDREMKSQVLDSMDIERERGITIKAQTASLKYLADDGQEYLLNLIDTPGHVDFSYEVSRSLSACDGALLLVDATQGVEAQTIANYYHAVDAGVKILTVINKIDLPSSEIETTKDDLESSIGVDASDALLCSAKTGVGIREILESIVKNIQHPVSEKSYFRALIIDSWFDNYVGVVILVRVFDGSIRPGDKIKMYSTKDEYECDHLGIFTPKNIVLKSLDPGMVGYIISGIRSISSARVGDTIYSSNTDDIDVLDGFIDVKSQVFAGVYPVESNKYISLRDAIDKLKLNDASLKIEPESSQSLGLGFRCGFLGLLHMDITQERLEREYGIDLVITAPTVVYEIVLNNGDTIIIDNPNKLPPPGQIACLREPIAKCQILVPQAYLGQVISLCIERRGMQIGMQYLGRQVMLDYRIPMSEIMVNFFDKLKSISRGYASLEYEFYEFQESDMVKIDTLINSEKVDSLSMIAHRSNSNLQARSVASKLRSTIPRQMFDIAIQMTIGSNIIARETVKALRKNVIAKCYGGDITRKKKLLEKQKDGKKRMKSVGKVFIPQEAFLAILKRD